MAWERAGLEPITPHEARHCAISYFIAAGLDWKQISTWAGHGDVRQTWNRYGHLVPGGEQAAAERLDAFLNPTNKAPTVAHEPGNAKTPENSGVLKYRYRDRYPDRREKPCKPGGARQPCASPRRTDACRMSANARGVRRERAVRDWLAARDWLAFRAPASLGCADVVALRDGSRPRLVEVKSTAGGPYEHFGPAARRRLSFAATIAGADAFLAWWPARGQLRWIGEQEWPS